LCGRCGAAFLDAAELAELSGGRYGKRAPRPVSGVQQRPQLDEDRPLPAAPLNPFGDPEHSGPLPLPPGFTPPPSPSGPVPSAPGPSPSSAGIPARASSPALPPPSGSFAPGPAAAPTGGRTVLYVALAAVVLLGVAGGVVAALALSGDDGDGAEVAQEETREERYARYMRHYPFGGQTVNVWNEYLARFRPGGPEANPQLYALTKERAERAGLVVLEETGGVRVEIEPKLVQRLLKRLELE
jgi:hypothetical protein